ncbi:MAG: hypothetical protein J6X61_00760 [Clostridia bacterium]|nr:hypothetical protein [Clostridia bacterium]
MKNTLRTLAALAALLMLLTACAPKELTFVGETPEGLFRADEAVASAVEALKAIGPFIEMKDTGRLIKTTKTDEATGTAVESYCDADGRLVYECYLGYGEDTFAYYPDGTVLPSLFCQDDGDKRVMARYTAIIDGVWVQVTTDGEMHRSDAYGAQKATVYTAPEGDRLTSAVYAVDFKENQARITLARYRKASGDWYAYTDEDGQPQEEPLWLKLTDPSPANIGGEKTLLTALAQNSGVTLSLTLGAGQNFYFTEDGDQQTWYLEAPLSVAFTDKSKRDSFRRQHPGGDAEDTASGTFVWKSRALLQLSGADLSETGFADTIDLMTSEFNDPVRYQIRLGELGEIQSFRSGVE